MKIYLSLLSALLVFASVNCQCQLTKQQIQNETRIFATKTKGAWKLWRQDLVPLGTRLYMICTERDIVSTVCRSRGTFQPSLPIQNCTKPLKASLQLSNDAACSAQSYNVGYRLNQTFMDLYSTCYDANTMSARFSKHKTYAYTAATNRPNTAFTTDSIISGAAAATFTARSIFQRFKQVLGPNQSYISSNKTITLDRGHLTPSADFAFIDNKSATFKYINVVPQFSSINRANWVAMENWLRQRLTQVGESTIITGVLDVLSLRNESGDMVPVYLAENGRNPIPKWLFKIVNDTQGTLVFMTYNNIYDAYPPMPNCIVQRCPVRFQRTKEAGFTFCCDPEDFLRNIVAGIL